MRFSAICVFLFLAIFQAFCDDKVKISVYFEALCPDSKAFIVDQLHPLMSGPLKENVQIELVPYGKAKTLNTDGKLTFKCQHGARECYSNMMIACVLNSYDQTRGLNYSRCIMSNSRPDKFTIPCAISNDINPDSLKSCQEGTQGPELLKAFGEKTMSLKPKMVFVPWITFNDQFTSQDQEEALTDLKKVVCSKIGSNKPGC